MGRPRKYKTDAEYLEANRAAARARYHRLKGRSVLVGGDGADAEGGRLGVAPDAAELDRLGEEMEAAGEAGIEAGSTAAFGRWLKRRAERELWFLGRWLLGLDHLGLGSLHREVVCPFLTDYQNTRFKLLMLPMGHLKTSCASRALPIHVMIQPKEANIYRSGLAGRDLRVLLANENEMKSSENLSWIRTHLEENRWLRWLWPEVLWEDAKRESPRWTDTRLQVRREAIWSESSITAVGIKTGFIGRYFDVIIGDDIAALEAAMNPALMQRADRWRRSAPTRLADKRQGVFLGVMTHWDQHDVCVEWKKDPRVELLLRGAIETDGDGVERSLWPEKFPLSLLEEMRAAMDPTDWQLWYMNNPVSRTAQAFRWNDLREFKTDGQFLMFEDNALDEQIEMRMQRVARNFGFVLGADRTIRARVRSAPPNGMNREYYDYMHDKYGPELENAGAPLVRPLSATRDDYSH